MGEPFKPFTITHVAECISEWGRNGFDLSRELLQYNVLWQLKLETGDQHFGVYLKCRKVVANENNEDWSIKVKYAVTLSSVFGRTYRGFFERHFNQDFTMHGSNDFIHLGNLYDDFVFDDQVIVETEITIIEMNGIGKKKKLMNFDDEDAKKLSDVTLCIGDQKFYVLKQLLARQSPYFHSMFFENFKEANMEEVPLKDVSPEDFQCFMEVINLEPTLSDDCVENVLQLADMYQAKNVTRQCEEFLIHQSHHSDKKLLQIVGRFKLHNLQERVFNDLRTKTDIRAATDPDLKNPEILQRLLDLALKYQY
ncbi:unnamed protein product [Caenorhabditis brenneri]